jgi:hypothetical protein
VNADCDDCDDCDDDDDGDVGGKSSRHAGPTDSVPDTVSLGCQCPTNRSRHQHHDADDDVGCRPWNRARHEKACVKLTINIFLKNFSL